MANAYNNKVVLSNGTTLIDLSTDTVTDASHIMSGKVGHLADGSVVTGTGASESQVVSIEDVPNTTGTTAVITGVAAPEGSISITTNGTHDVTAYEEAIVNVPSQTPTIQPLSVTSNGTYTAPSGVDGYSPVTVNVSGGGGAVSLLYTDTVTVSTTSTTAETVKTVTFSANNDEAGMFSSSGPLLCIIYDNAGLRDGYFSYSLNFIDPPNITVRCFVHSRTAAGVGRTDSVNYGLYLSSYSSSASDGVRSYSAEISSRYHSTYSQTLDGTYTIKFFRIHLGLLPTS